VSVPVLELKDADFTARLAETEQAIVDFHVGRNVDCILVKPKFFRLAEEYPHVSFFVADSEHAPRAHERINLEQLPHFGVFRRGQPLELLSTAEERALRALLERHFGRS
jgi:thioredoxin-like negative regulator of GroEL